MFTGDGSGFDELDSACFVPSLADSVVSDVSAVASPPGSAVFDVSVAPSLIEVVVSGVSDAAARLTNSMARPQKPEHNSSSCAH